MLAIVKEYAQISQIHGIRFIVEPGRNWTERLFWTCCLLLSWYGSIALILTHWDKFQHNAISFGIETTYLDWNNSLFSVTLCEQADVARADATAERMYGVERDFNLDEILKEIAFFKGNSYYIKEYCTDEEETNCPNNGFHALSAEIRSKCSDIFEKCTWMGKEFDCCKHFLPLETERGICYSINSIHTKKQNPYPLISNRHTGPGTLYIRTALSVNCYFHSSADVPHIGSLSTEYFSMPVPMQLFRRYTIVNIEDDMEVPDVSIKQRKCRYPNENYLKIYDHYSYTACIAECRIEWQREHCGCVIHLTPKATPDTSCDLDGLICMIDLFENYSTIINPWSNRQGLICSCLPGCSEPEYITLQEGSRMNDESDSAEVEMILDRLSTDRFKRNVVRGKLDLVVAIGGTIGLFVGASLLTIVEFIYYFTIRIVGSFVMRKERELTEISESESTHLTEKVKHRKVFKTLELIEHI